MIQSKRLRKELRKYNEDLLARKLMVPCPICKAKVGELCLGRHKKRTASTHWDRALAAKRAGFLKVSKGGRP